MKGKKGEGFETLTVVFVTFLVAVVIGIVLINFMQEETTRTSIVSDTFTASNTSYVTITSKCISPNTISYMNASTNATISAGNFTVKDGGVILDANLEGTVLHGDNVNATYTEESCGYQTGTTGTVLRYIGLAVALVLFVFVTSLIKGGN